jgi:glycosyltransferase involved in cell wall biosynthesis
LSDHRPSHGVRVLQALQPPDGGAARHVLDLSLGLRERGFQVEVAAPPECVAFPELEGAGVTVHRMPLVREPGRRDVRAARELRRLDRRRGFDLVHAHSSKAGALVRLALPGRRRLVYTPHCLAFVTTDFGPVTRAVYRVVEEALAPRTAALVAVSEWEGGVARGLRGLRGRVRVIPNGARACPGSKPHPELERWRGDLPLAALISKLRPEKDPLALVRAASALVARGALPGRVAVIGNGELEAEVRAEIDRLGAGERVRWFPFADGTDRYLAAIDLLVVPSHWESLPIAPIEAMACGVPVLATAVGGLPELVRDGVSGRLIAARDAPALESALGAMLTDLEALRRMGAAARTEATGRFGLEPMIDRTAALYDELVGRGAAG